MKHGEWYIVNDLVTFVDAARALVFNSFGNKTQSFQDDSSIGITTVSDSELDEFNRILSHDESILIAKEILRKQINKITAVERYLVSDKLYSNLVSRLNERMIGNIIHSLVNKGLVETAFDDESNDFIFWCKYNEDLPETD